MEKVESWDYLETIPLVQLLSEQLSGYKDAVGCLGEKEGQLVVPVLMGQSAGRRQLLPTHQTE